MVQSLHGILLKIFNLLKSGNESSERRAAFARLEDLEWSVKTDRLSSRPRA